MESVVRLDNWLLPRGRGQGSIVAHSRTLQVCKCFRMFVFSMLGVGIVLRGDVREISGSEARSCAAQRTRAASRLH